MAMQTKKSSQDYMAASFGEHGFSKPTANVLEIGAVSQDGTLMERLPIGTSSAGTAVLVDLIASEAITVTVGSVGINGFTGTAGSATLTRLVATSAGALTTSGTVTGVGVVADGTVKVGNLVAGTITKLEGGTVGNLASGSVVVTAGTIANLNTIGTVGVINAGSVVVTAGTIGDMDTVGTVGVLNSGSVVVTAGTITAGTVKINAVPGGSAVLTTHVLGTGGTTWGSLVAPVGAGTSIYVTGYSIVGHTGTADYVITNNVAGSTGAGVLGRGFFPPGGGITHSYNPAIQFGTNGTIAYLVVGPGTASFTVDYWVGP